MMPTFIPMKNVITLLKQPWSFYRWLRLALGFYFIYESVNHSHLVAGLFGALMLYQAVVNSKYLPCEMYGTCAPTPTKTDSDHLDEVVYEEVK